MNIPISDEAYQALYEAATDHAEGLLMFYPLNLRIALKEVYDKGFEAGRQLERELDNVGD